jgi:hypothetical protein
MLSGAEIQSGLAGAWRLMMGRADGLRLLDLSADGFWNSFFAIVVAVPPMALGWMLLADHVAGNAETVSRGGLFLRYGLTDLGTWLLPLAGFAVAARPAGIADRFVPYVVASNWGSALLAWLTLPPAIVTVLAPAATDIIALLKLLFFGLSLLFGWRLTNAVIDRGAALGTAVFAAMFAASLIVLLLLQALLGLSLP